MAMSQSVQKPHYMSDSVDPSYQLLFYASHGNVDGLIEELKGGVSPNLADYDKRTALHLASCEGHTDIVKILLEHKANVNFVDRWGSTPLSNARRCNHKDICDILKARGGLESYQNEIDLNEVDLKNWKLIGEGSYGEIYLVKWRGVDVAAKTIRASIASKPKIRSNFRKELDLWQTLRHPNIVQFFGVVNDNDRLIFLTEYLPNGNLDDVLKRKGRLDAHTAVKYALDIARGMNYLHQHKPTPIIHRDLTPRNVLQDEEGHLKVTDFGLSRIVQDKNVAEPVKMTGGTGSYRYMAPEIYREENYDKSIDVFSFAFIVQEATSEMLG
ncbi:serine/threonine-protein kinase VIK isoform X2 [Cryptomeria japonica]|uniref:serine/threonine-protein kinase VIK isoform X2 n=1 Tax=Cryptomeria japonica TaxID=3369 RepID=UPI0027DA0719|nr:serine/threonine-protein kinase VIK isoform X2 [Cryptomeria japonica]